MTGMAWLSTATGCWRRPRIVSRRSDCTPQRMAVQHGAIGLADGVSLFVGKPEQQRVPRLAANAGAA